jgi:hypothetical protein
MMAPLKWETDIEEEKLYAAWMSSMAKTPGKLKKLLFTVPQ